METLSLLMDGFAVAGTPENLMIALIGCFIGTVVGLLPGLGPINGVAILLPIAFDGAHFQVSDAGTGARRQRRGDRRREDEA